MKKAYLKTYGCQMNEQDTRQMETLLGQSGYARTNDPLDADFALINTCAVREKAVHKIYSDLGRMRLIRENNPNLLVGVAGCVVEQEKEALVKRFPFVDLLFGPDHIRHLPEMLGKAEERRDKQGPSVLHVGFDARKDFQFVNVLPNPDESPVKAFVNIQKGCDNICSFCIVPFVRGREVSRPAHEILAEIKALTERGVKEVMLLGQNVNSYGFKSNDGVSFAELLERIATQTNLSRLRFTSSHPKDVKDDLIDQYANNPVLAPHFHLPVQAGSDAVLKAMRRQYSRDDYLRIIDSLKARVPGIAFSTDIIVGFPGESDADFRQTLSLMEVVRYDLVYSFAYSPRPYTSAIKLADDVPLEVKKARLAELQALSDEHTLAIHESVVGQIKEVLVETCDDSDTLVYKGRTGCNKVVHFTGTPCTFGDRVQVIIKQANPHSLFGETACPNS